MNSLRVVFKCLDARAAIEKYDGPLYNALFSRVIEFMCKWQTGSKEDFETVEEWLLLNNIAAIKDGDIYPKVPLLTVDVAKKMQEEILNELPKDFSGSKYVKEIVEKSDNWEEIGHNFVSQVLLGGLLFNAWMRKSDNPSEPVALIVTDLDHSPVFIPGLVPLTGNEIISYLQTNQFGHPDTLYDIFTSRAVRKSLESINHDYTFNAVDNTLVLFNKLKMYKNKTVRNNPIPYISLPKINYPYVKGFRKELSKLSDNFFSQIEILDKVAKEFYNNRPEILKMIDYCNYRNMVFYVYNYCLVDDYLEKNLLVTTRLAKDTKSKSSSPKWKMS